MNPIEKELCRAILDDPHAMAEVAGAADDGERTSIVLRLGELLGLPVSREAVERFFALAPDDELSDMELEMVVGGKGGGGDKHIKGHDSNWWNDFWHLTNDDLDGGGGNDTLEGLGGNDTLHGHEGNDKIDGGKGKDQIYGGPGNDSVDGGEDNDYVHGGAGHDSIYGGSGNDTLFTGEGNDTIYGESGDDFIYGNGNGDKFLDGGEGNDKVGGDFGDDVIKGGEGDDTLAGGWGSDTIEGGAGDDVLSGYWFTEGITLDGRDVFVFGRDDGHDTITDFDVRQDRLLLRGVESPDDIEVVNFHGSTMVVYGDTEIILRGVQLDQNQVWKLVDSE